MHSLIRLWAALLGCLPVISQNQILLKGLLPATLDYRLHQSPVKDQAARGTCIAFSVAAVMETFDGVPSDLSEQAAYGYIKLQELGDGKISPGGLLANYPDLLMKPGFMHESVAPYDPKSGLWSKSDHVLKQYLAEGKTGIADLVKRVGTTRYKVETGNVIFLQDDAARDPVAIKRLLADGHRAVAVGYTKLYAPYWSRYRSGVLTPGEGFLYSINDKSFNYNAAKALRPRLAEAIIAGEVKVMRADDSPKGREHYGGHAVTVVGYTTNGFIIKNSWGRDWGMNGYAVVSYDYHRIFCDEALAVKEVSAVAQPVEGTQRPVLYLKSRPNLIGDRHFLRLSLFGPQTGGLLPFRDIKYQIYEQKSDGTRGELIEEPTPGVLSLVGVGFPTDVLGGHHRSLGIKERKYWVQVSFGTAGELMQRIVTFPNVTWANHEYRGH